MSQTSRSSRTSSRAGSSTVSGSHVSYQSRPRRNSGMSSRSPTSIPSYPPPYYHPLHPAASARHQKPPSVHSRHSGSAHSRPTSSEHSRPGSAHSHRSSSTHTRLPGYHPSHHDQGRNRDSIHSQQSHHDGGSVHSQQSHRGPGSLHSKQSHQDRGSVHSQQSYHSRGRAHSPQSYQNIAYGGPYQHDEPSVEDQVRYSAELTADEEPVQVYDSVSQAGLAFDPQYHDSDMPPPPLPPLHTTMMPPPMSPRYSHHGSHHGSGSGPASWVDHHQPRGEQQFPPRRRSIGLADNEYSLGPTPSVDGRRNSRELPARRSSRSDKRERKGTKKTGIKVAGGSEVVRRFNGQLALVRKPKKRS